VRLEYDLVLLTCKAYDLDAAIASIRPAMGPSTHVLPLLNGLAHVDRLIAEFGAARVIGGTCGIPATLTPDGDVVQLGPLHRIAYGMLSGTSPGARAKIEQLHALYTKTPIDAVLAEDVAQELWEKFVLLTTLATMTCLMRGAVGDIVAADEGAALIGETLEACARTAAAAGHAPRDKALAAFRKLLLERGSAFTASMLRDVESGNRTEGEHIVGDMLRRARAAGVEPGPLRAGYCNLQTYAVRRERDALARAAT
jgi:2-dehydropantoate 2-reductase